jgi:hypothetical protein
LKYSLSAVSLPVRIWRASVKLIFLRASRKICFGLGGSALGGAVHADFEGVHRTALAEPGQGLADDLEFRR